MVLTQDGNTTSDNLIRERSLCTFLNLQTAQKHAILCMEAQNILNKLKSSDPKDWEEVNRHNLVANFQYLVMCKANGYVDPKEEEECKHKVFLGVRKMALDKCREGLYPTTLKPDYIYVSLKFKPDSPYDCILY